MAYTECDRKLSYTTAWLLHHNMKLDNYLCFVTYCYKNINKKKERKKCVSAQDRQTF